MSKTSHELSRKEMKEPDQFQVVAGQAAGWVASHQKKIVALVGGLLALLLVGGAFSFYRDSQNEKAGALLYSATQTPDDKPFKNDDERYQAIIAGCEKVRAAYPSTNAGQTALLLMSDARFRLGKFDEAIKGYQEYLSNASQENSLRWSALEGLAYAHEGKGDHAQAMVAIERLGRESSAFKDRSALEKARLLVKMQKPDEAKAILQSFSKDFAGSLLQGEASTQLEQLSAK